ncbi:hypothetical protein [Sulfuricurvum sp.]|uniref:hypothetical protein n=1 Tax=Sulfuricurvum sp. TaxID=2025608 RepID=UPI0035636091
MKNAITKICVTFFLVASVGFFKFQQELVADSYVAGSTPSTLQSTLETGNTGARTDANTMELSATATYDALQITHTSQPGQGGDGLQITMPNTTGTGVAARLASTNTGDVLNITKTTRAGYGINITNTGSTGGIQIDTNAANARGIYIAQQNGSGNESLLVDHASTGNNAVSAKTYYASTAPYFGYNWFNQTTTAAQSDLMKFNSRVDGVVNQAFAVSGYGHIAAGFYSGIDNTNVIFASTTVVLGGARVQNNANTADGGSLLLDRKRGDGSIYQVAQAGDDIFNVTWEGLNDTGTSTLYTYGQIATEIVSPATGTIDGGMYFRVVDDGVLAAPITMVGGTEMITMAWPVTANTLQFDDEPMDTYNEGTYTVVYAGDDGGDCATATTEATGTYTQIGNVVHVDIRLTVGGSCAIAPTGTPYVTLPISQKTASGYYANMTVGTLAGFGLTAGNIMIGYVDNSNDKKLYLQQWDTATSTQSDAPNDEDFTAQFSITYMTD